MDTDEELQRSWLAGWNSAASACEDALAVLLEGAVYRPEQSCYQINTEQLDALRYKLKNGLYKQMRVGDRAGLDYYFATTDPSSIRASIRRDK